MSDAARRFTALEPLLVLLAGPFLVVREWGVLPDWTEAAALGWLALLWIVRRILTGRWTVGTTMDVPVLALLLTLPGAIWVARPDFGHTPAALSRAESLLFAIALAYAIANFVSSRRRAWAAAIGILIMGIGVALAGAVTVDWLVKYPVLEPIIAQIPQVTERIPHATLRTSAHPNQLAGLLAIVLPLGAAIVGWPRIRRWAHGRRRSRKFAPPLVRAVAAVTLVLLTPLMLLTQSRGGLAALGVAVLGIGLVAFNDRMARKSSGRFVHLRGVLIAGVLAAALLLAVFPGALDMATSGRLPEPQPQGPDTRSTVTGSAIGRLYLWRESLEMLDDVPLTGIGLHNFVWRHALRTESHGVVFPGLSHSHNIFLQSALDYGLPGAVSIAGLAVALGWAAIRARRHLYGTRVDPLVIGTAAGLVAWTVHGLFDAVAIGSKPGFIPWSMAGLLVGLRAHAAQLAEEGPERRKRRERRSDATGAATGE